LSAAPAPFPPMTPAISWMMRLTIASDTLHLPVP
jgi:hypothetical protein